MSYYTILGGACRHLERIMESPWRQSVQRCKLYVPLKRCISMVQARAYRTVDRTCSLRRKPYLATQLKCTALCTLAKWLLTGTRSSSRWESRVWAEPLRVRVLELRTTYVEEGTPRGNGDDCAGVDYSGSRVVWMAIYPMDSFGLISHSFVCALPAR